MVYVFFLLTGLSLLLIQTAILPIFPLFHGSIDLLVPLVIHIAVSRSLREGIPFILLLGFLVDNLSGSPMFLFMMVYFWLLLSVRLILQIFQVGSYGRLAILVAFGVLLKNLLLTLFYYTYLPGTTLPLARLGLMAVEIIAGALLGPFLIMTFESLTGFILKLRGKPSAGEAE